ncbi:MAG: thiamine phosphate synthase [Chitinophagales bacterium]|nr:thiamine phosphate synthase [Chitinophagales bacterium]
MEIKKGLYVIVDPSMEAASLLQKLELVVQDEITSAVQIWDHFKDENSVYELVNKIINISHKQNKPVFINNRWELLRECNLDGIHFDAPIENLDDIRKKIGKKFLVGITCGNDLSVVEWAKINKVDYISFCSMFPSSSAGSCELVNFETVRKASAIANIPVFLAGGINPNNLSSLKDLPYYGIAVISGIMNTNETLQQLQLYKHQLNLKYESGNN